MFFNSALSKGVQKGVQKFRTYKQKYEVLRYYRMIPGQRQFYEKFSKGYKIANVRNPFARVYSAWHDKARTHLFPNKSIDYSSFGPNFHNSNEEKILKMLNNNAISFHNRYYPAIKLFETIKPPDGMNYSFPARV